MLHKCLMVWLWPLGREPKFLVTQGIEWLGSSCQAVGLQQKREDVGVVVSSGPNSDRRRTVPHTAVSPRVDEPTANQGRGSVVGSGVW